MSKWLVSGVILLLAIIGLVTYFSQGNTFISSTSEVDPVIKTVNLGQMRTDPGIVDRNKGDKGFYAKDAVAEIKRQVLEENSGRLNDNVIAIEFKFLDVEGREIPYEEVMLKDNKDVLIDEIRYIVNLYKPEAFTDSTYKVLKPNATPVGSTQYAWSLYRKDAKDKADDFNPKRPERYPSAWSSIGF